MGSGLEVSVKYGDQKRSVDRQTRPNNQLEADARKARAAHLWR
jgi:hypothetical protein